LPKCRSDASSTPTDSLWVALAVVVNVLAAASSSTDAAETVSMISPTAASKPSAKGGATAYGRISCYPLKSRVGRNFVLKHRASGRLEAKAAG
jgi:hypothetical protein